MLHRSTVARIIYDSMISCNNFRCFKRDSIPRSSRIAAAALLSQGHMDGIHLLGEWFGCPWAPAMIDVEALREVCVDATVAAGLTPVGEKFHQFQPQGVTGMVLLAESHLAIHTWPEAGFVSVDVYVCNVRSDNSARAEQLYAMLKRALKPAAARDHRLERGSSRAMPAAPAIEMAE